MAIFFWTGPESFLINEKKNYWISSFIKKYGSDINVSVLDGKSISINQIISEMLSMPFLGDKRLLFVENVPPRAKEKLKSENTDALLEAIDQVSDETVLVFIQSNPDKRLSFYKKFIKKVEVEEFNEHKGAQLTNWVKLKIKKEGGDILPAAVSFLVDYVGTSLWKLNNEIDKLLNFTNTQKAISENDIRLVCSPEVNADIFRYLDNFSKRKKQEAIQELQNLHNKGESLMYVFALMVKQIREMLLVKSLKNPTKDDLTKKLKLHPFVASKMLYFVKNFDFSELKTLYNKCLEIDKGIKTGEIQVQTSDERMLQANLEMLIMSHV